MKWLELADISFNMANVVAVSADPQSPTTRTLVTVIDGSTCSVLVPYAAVRRKIDDMCRVDMLHA